MQRRMQAGYRRQVSCSRTARPGFGLRPMTMPQGFLLGLMAVAMLFATGCAEDASGDTKGVADESSIDRSAGLVDAVVEA